MFQNIVPRSGLCSAPGSEGGLRDQTRVAKEKETILKEAVMIPCTYYRGLMAQAYSFCPECRARRKLRPYH